MIARIGTALESGAARGRSAQPGNPRAGARRAATAVATAALRMSSADTALHSGDVDVISEEIGHRLGLVDAELDDVLTAARLHDLGKIAVPTRILDKPGRLDSSEWDVLRRHTVLGAMLLRSVPEMASVADLVRHSHERWDGGGYPDGLSGEEIPIGSRIIFCADAFHAIRSDRPYRRGATAEHALAEIRACAGTQFDPRVVEALEAVGGSSAIPAETVLPGTGPGAR